MTKQLINIGTGPNDKTGDPLRTAFAKVNANFGELYSAVNSQENLLGILTVVDQTIIGHDTNGDIVLSPNGTGTVIVPSLKVDGYTAISAGSEVISNIVNRQTLAAVALDSVNALPANTYGNPSSIPAPWAAYQFTATPNPVIQLGDAIAGAGIPALSNVVYVGNGAYSTWVVTNIVPPNGGPAAGISITTTRLRTNNAMILSTLTADTDISLRPSSTYGRVISGASIHPDTTDVYNLGTPAHRWREIWLGAGTLYVEDETLGIDLAIGAKDGNLYVEGAAGLTVGEFTFVDNQIKITNNTRDIIIGTPSATGNVTLNRPFKITSGATGLTTFSASREGRIQIMAPNIPTADQGAFNIVGSSDGSYQPVNGAGGMIHITGNDNTLARITVDAYATSTTGPQPAQAGYGLIALRAARGTAATPSYVLANDILASFSGLGYVDGSGYSTGQVAGFQFFAAEDFVSNSHKGTYAQFKLTPVGGSAGIVAMQFNSNGIDLVNAGSSITFGDRTVQTTAWTGTQTTASFGNIQISGDTILDKVSGNELNISTQGRVAGVNMNVDHLHVHTTSNTKPVLDISNDGTAYITAPAWSNQTAALSVDASPLSSQIPPAVPGVVIQTTGQDGVPSRIYNDASASYAAWLGRRYNGTTNSPTGVVANDVISRVGAEPWLSTGGFTSLSTARMDFVATETQTGTAQGNEIQFWTTTPGTTTLAKHLAVDYTGIKLYSGITFSDSTVQSTAAVPLGYMGAANGVATLDSSGKVTTAQLPTGAVVYKGSWDASVNNPSLANGSGTSGWEYSVITGGTVNFGAGNIAFVAGDFVIYNGTTWNRIPGGSNVSAFNTRTGAITLTSLDVTNALTYTPYNATTNINGYVNSAGASAAAPVQSVFGRAGNVALATSDVTGVLTAGTITNTMLAANSLTIGSTNIALGGTASNLAGLTSVTATNLTGTLQTASQTNITAIGSLSSLSVTGTAAIGTVSTGQLNVGTLSYTDTGILAEFSSNVAGYNQLVMQNKSTDAGASTNLIVSNNLGTATTNYGQLGMNSSTFTGTGSFNIGGAVYLTSVSTDLSIGTMGYNSIHFATNNGATDAMTIGPTGVVTVANTIQGSVSGNAGSVTNGVYTTSVGTVTGTMIANSTITNNKLQYSSITINGTTLSLGPTNNIILVPADTGLTGTTLASTIVNSSLTSVGTLTNLTVTNAITGSITGNAATVTNGVYTTGSYANPTWITSLDGSKISNFVANATNATNASTVTNGVYTSGSYADPSWITSLAGTKITGFVANATNATSAGNSTTVTNGVYTTDTGTVTNTMLAGNIANSKLLNSSVTVTAGTGLSGGGTVALGGTITLTNAGVTSVNGGTGAITSIATLDGSGYLTASQIPPSLTGAVVYKGTWDASANNPSLVNGTGTSGNEYVVTVAGTHNFGAGNITFVVGDFVIYNGTVWSRIPSGTVGVVSFNTRTGAVTLSTSDVTTVLTANTITNTMLSGSIDNTKLSNSSVTVTAGTGMSGGGTVALGGTITVTNAGVTSLAGASNISVSGSTGGVSITRVDGFQTVVTGNNTASYAVQTTDQYVGTIHSTTGSTIVTLPLGSTVTAGRQFVIKDEGGQAGLGSRRITVTASGSDTIDGSATRTITSNYGALTVIWTGTRWSVI